MSYLGTEPFRSGANSLRGANRPIGPWPFSSLELSRKVFRIGTVRYHWPMSAHASQAFSIASCIDSEDLPLSLPGLYAPRPFRSRDRTYIPWNFRSLNVFLTVYFRCLTLAFMPITQCEDQNNKIKKVQHNGREYINKIQNYEQNSTQCIKNRPT